MIKVAWEFAKSTFRTKNFIFNAVVYGLAIIVTTVYCYGRLDYVRSYAPPKKTEIKQK